MERFDRFLFWVVRETTERFVQAGCGCQSRRKQTGAGGITCDLGFELLLDSGDLLLLNGPFKNRADIFPLPSSNCIRPRTPLQKPIEESVIATTSYQNGLNKHPTCHSSVQLGLSQDHVWPKGLWCWEERKQKEQNINNMSILSKL